MTQKLRIAADLALPLDAVTQKLAFLGRTGTGKTYAATKLAELMLEHDAQVIALDPVGKWYGLRVPGTGPGFDIPVFGGLYGDLPLVATAGAEIADFIVDRGSSAILDVSQFESDAQKARFAEKFAERFFFRKKAAPSAVHIFLEECQEFVPQNPAGGEQDMLHFWTRMAKLGRNFGIGVSLISQRPQEVNKKVLNMTEGLFAFQMRGPQERKTIKDWSSDKDLEVDIVAELPSLPEGTAFVSSPQWLEVEKRVAIGKKRTADVSATPLVGASQAPVKPLTPIDLEELRVTMAATIEKAKASDPDELKKRIRELEAQARKGAPAPDPAAVRSQIDAAVEHGLNAERQRLERYRRVLRGEVENVVRRLQQRVTETSLVTVGVEVEAATQMLQGVIENIDQNWMPAPASTTSPTSGAARATAAVPSRAAAPARLPDREVHRRVTTDGGVGRASQRILDAIAFYESLGEATPTREMVAAFIGVTVGGSFSARLSEVRGPGYLVDADGGRLALTPAGRAIADPSSLPKSLRELHDKWLAKLKGKAAEILRALIEVYPDSITREALAAHVGVTMGGSFSARLSEVRSPGLLTDLGNGEVRATDLLFPAGLR